MHELLFPKNTLESDPPVYDMTLRGRMEWLAKQYPDMTAFGALNWFYGYLGTKGAPTIDAGIFLHHFLNAVDDGLFKLEAKI